MSGKYTQELRIASLAVQFASLLTKVVAASANRGTLEKTDASIVTVADFAVQALLISVIHTHFPGHSFVGEEPATALRNNPELLDRVWGLVSTVKLDDPASQALLVTPSSKEAMLDIIDLGNKDVASQNQSHVWILDPIDGTQTYVTGEQYAVCLALLERGKQKIGILGCPNLHIGGPIQEAPGDQNGNGIMLYAVAEMGAYVRTMSTGVLEPAHRLEKLRDIKDSQTIRFIDCPTHPSISPNKHRMVAQRLGSSWPGTELWAMQMKYAALALGGGDVAIRIPPKKEFRPYVWDHAGGQLIFEETGGRITDLDGKAIDFNARTKLEKIMG